MSGLKQFSDWRRENSIPSGQIVRLCGFGVCFLFFITFQCGNRHGLFPKIIGGFSSTYSLPERSGVVAVFLVSAVLAYYSDRLQFFGSGLLWGLGSVLRPGWNRCPGKLELHACWIVWLDALQNLAQWPREKIPNLCSNVPKTMTSIV